MSLPVSCHTVAASRSAQGPWLRRAAWTLVSALAVSLCFAATGNTPPAPPASPHLAAEDLTNQEPGGATTVPATGRNAFSFPLANLDDAERQRFAIGNSFFRRNWVEAPSSTTARDGLGPLFIARSCGGCHDQDGRGAPPTLKARQGEPAPLGLLMRLSIPAPEAGPGATKPDPVYGDQFADRGIAGVPAEGVLDVKLEPVRGHFEDGTKYTLMRPHYRLTKLNYGPLAKGVLTSPRIAPQLPGVGLLEAIAEDEIVAEARRQAMAPGPVKGQPNWIVDAGSKQRRIGRFGWKANAPSLLHQTAGAFAGDMGITSTLFTDEGCSATQTACRKAPRGANGAGPEIDDATLAQVAFYEATLAPAARRNAADPDVLRGQQLFAAADCAACHRPSYVTPTGPGLASAKLGGQRIYPYTDLLLHDMGDGLADGRPDGLANGRQWKTPPLWGIGLIPDVNGHQRLLHDGRADGVMEAVLWHGGEAEASRRKVLALRAADRAALVKFVESL